MTIKIAEEIIQKMLNKDQAKKDVNWKYEVSIGDYPIRITLGKN